MLWCKQKFSILWLSAQIYSKPAFILGALLVFWQYIKKLVWQEAHSTVSIHKAVSETLALFGLAGFSDTLHANEISNQTKDFA